MNSSAPLRLGILGAAGIAGKFAQGAASSHRVRIVAVASRELAKARRFAAEHGIGKALGSYEALLDLPDVDAIYNPLPNALHAPWTLRALRAGKHVLCEKPLALSVDEARAMFEAAKASGRVLLEGYPYRYQPITLRLQDLLEQGAIGQVEYVQAAFGFTMSDASNIRLDGPLGGGALFDAGSYPISLVRMIAKSCPQKAQALGSWISAGVDRTITAQFEFADGMRAQVACSFGTAPHRHALIAGSDGIIETTFINHPPLDRPATLLLRRGTSWETANQYQTIEAQPMNGFHAEMEAFSELVTKGPDAWRGTTASESIDGARMMDAVRRSAVSGCMEEV